ncbi:MAG: hypothetical protein HZC17_04635 [Candidatus Omnitrophica bacterium]|nr:hypothetical protein [Candidatus Omnitrophota bacterium]
MIRWLPLIILIGLLVYLVVWARKWYMYGGANTPTFTLPKPFRKESLKESWIQIYETASKDEADQLKAHFEELEIQSIAYEQGKKGVDGKSNPGIGFAVPRSQMLRAQNLLFRFLDRKK